MVLILHIYDVPLVPKGLDYMKTMTWNEVFGRITGKRNPKRTMQNAKWITLSEDVWFDGYEYAKGSQYKVFETPNFGWVVFHLDTRTPNGNIPFRRIHKF